MEYELIIERRQPPCGGKPPRLHTFLAVETDDPIAYVRDNEPDLPENTPMDISDDGKGVITVSFVRGVQVLSRVVRKFVHRHPVKSAVRQ